MMNRLFLVVLVAFVCLVGTTVAQKKKATPSKQAEPAAAVQAGSLDFRLKPKVSEPREFEFPKFTEVKLKSGLKVYVIEDHAQPTIQMRLQVRAGEAFDGNKYGLSFMTTNLLTKGTQKKNALEIANAIDSVGASLNANSSGEIVSVSIDGLKKHMPLLLSTFSDVVLNPLFPQEEIDKLVPQVLASIKQEKSRPMELASALARKVVYGEKHPSAFRKTEESVKRITAQDIREFHDKYFRPNNQASLAIVGDVTPKEIVPMLEKAFKSWTANSVTIPDPPAPKPMARGVYFIERPNSVQSTMMITVPAMRRSDNDYEKLQLATSVLGSGFGGKLFKTLRETYSFTYTPFGFMSSGKYANRATFGAEVRSAVTDSAILITQEQIADVAKNPTKDEEFDLIKKSDIGRFLMSFEEKSFIASILQQADYLGLPLEYMKDYAKRLNYITPTEVQRVAQRYFAPQNQYIVVAGNPELAKQLEKYGDVYRFNLDLEPVGGGSSMEQVSISVADLMKKNAQALGGESALNAIQTIKKTGDVTFAMGGQQIKGTSQSIQKVPAKKFFSLDLPIMTQRTWVNGSKAWMQSGPSDAEEMKENDAETAMLEASMFNSCKLPSLGYTCEIVGKKAGKIIVKATSKKGTVSTYYYDATTFLLSKIERVEESPMGSLTLTEKFENYTEINGVKFAKTERLESDQFNVSTENTIEVNTQIDDAVFQPKK